MFRLSFIAIITLRVTICPVLCMGGGEVAQTGHTAGAHTAESRGCCSGGSTPCRDDNSRTPSDAPDDCPCPCESGDCQVITDLIDRTASIDSSLEVVVDFLTVSCDTLFSPQGFAFRGEDLSHRLDLTSGRSVRLTHASLLL